MIIIYSFLIIIVAFVPIIREIQKGVFDIFNAKNAFILYYVIQLCFSGLLSIYFPTKGVTSLSLYGHDRMNLFENAFLLSLTGIFFFQIGYYSCNKSIKIPLGLPSIWKKTNVYIIVNLYLVIGLFSYLFLIKNNGGFSGFAESREEFRAGGMIGQGFLIYPSTTLIAIVMLIYSIWHYKDNQENNKSNKNIIFLLLCSIIPSFLLGFRGFIILPVISFIVIYNYLYSPINLKKLLPISAFVLVFFVGFGIYRELPQGASINLGNAYEVLNEQPELAYNFLSRSKGVEVVATEIQKLKETQAYDLGYKSIFESTTIFIHKRLWE